MNGIKRTEATDDKAWRSKLSELYADDELLFMDGHDNAVIGVTEDTLGSESVRKLVYDYETVMENLIKEHGDELGAIEWYSVNIAGSYVGERTPIIMQPIGKCDECS